MDPSEAFYRQFRTTSANIREQITKLPSLSAVGGERQDAIDAILADISRLSQDVVDAGDFVPAYDQRGYVQVVKELKDELETTKARFGPKKSRFQFKRPGVGAGAGSSPSLGGQGQQHEHGQEDTRRFVPSDFIGDNSTVPSKTPLGDDTPLENSKDYNKEISSSGTDSTPRRPSFSASRCEVSLHDHQNRHIILPSSATNATSAGSGSITSIKDCIIDMSVPTKTAPFANLALKNITGSVIVAGRVDGSVHITGVKDSVVVIVSRQVRIHECEGVDFYLWVGSHPIIEDCKGVRFAPVAESFVTEKETPETNQWDQVDDFKWLKSEHSPNWCILPEAERISQETWDIVKGDSRSAELGLSDILRKIGLGS
ncbi:Tubulin binding cofactor C domain containing protein, partial [Naviculisporaceae sp. PSN 640]